jgi:hypothetical protein
VSPRLFFGAAMRLLSAVDRDFHPGQIELALAGSGFREGLSEAQIIELLLQIGCGVVC